MVSLTVGLEEYYPLIYLKFLAYLENMGKLSSIIPLKGVCQVEISPSKIFIPPMVA